MNVGNKGGGGGLCPDPFDSAQGPSLVKHAVSMNSTTTLLANSQVTQKCCSAKKSRSLL